MSTIKEQYNKLLWKKHGMSGGLFDFWSDFPYDEKHPYTYTTLPQFIRQTNETLA